MSSAKDQIVKALEKAIHSKDIQLEFPENEEFGDWATNVAMVILAKSKSKGDLEHQKMGKPGRTAKPAILAPDVNQGGGSRFSTLQDTRKFYSRLKEKSQAAFSLDYQEAGNPRQLAEEIARNLRKDKELAKFVEKMEVAGPGFINFWLKKEILLQNLEEIGKEKEKYGNSSVGRGKTAIVEYSSPNIAKPFGVGHLRSTVIGDCIANLMEATGWKVMRDNHLGDWGTQFGKTIYAIKTWGDEGKIEKSENPVKDLVDLYVKFHQEAEKDPSLEDEARRWFKKLEDGDGEAKRLWQKCVDWSWVEFSRIYQKLGVTFSQEFDDGRGFGESFFERMTKTVTRELKEKGLLKVGEEGAKLVFFGKAKYPPLMIIKKDGATLYATRDLATDKYRKEKYQPDLVINEVGSEQGLYFKQIFEVEKMLGWYKEGQRVHVGHGLFLYGGKKMSTRGGESVELEEVLTQAIKKARAIIEKSETGRGLNSRQKEKVSEVVGVGAIKYYDLSHHPSTNINFDWNKIFVLEGNSGPYLQYTVARGNSVLAKADKPTGRQTFKGVNLNPAEWLVLRTLVKFPEVVEAAATTYAPNLLCSYLYDLAQKYNAFYDKHRIISDKREATRSLKLRVVLSEVERTISEKTSQFRLMLTAGTGQVLKTGLKLLGIQAPERM